MTAETREYVLLGRRVLISTDQLRFRVRAGNDWIVPDEIRPFGRCYACTVQGEPWLIPSADVETTINLGGNWVEAVAV